MKIFRLPTKREVVALARTAFGLFTAPASVDDAIVELSRASDRMEAVIAYQNRKAEAAWKRHHSAIARAKAEEATAQGHKAEKERAVRVFDRLAELLA